MNRKELYILALITFLTVCAWIIFGFFHAGKTSTIDDKSLIKIVPLTPTFDNETIRQLNSRGDY